MSNVGKLTRPVDIPRPTMGISRIKYDDKIHAGDDHEHEDSVGGDFDRGLGLTFVRVSSNVSFSRLKS